MLSHIPVRALASSFARIFSSIFLSSICVFLSCARRSDISLNRPNKTTSIFNSVLDKKQQTNRHNKQPTNQRNQPINTSNKSIQPTTTNRHNKQPTNQHNKQPTNHRNQLINTTNNKQIDTTNNQKINTTNNKQINTTNNQQINITNNQQINTTTISYTLQANETKKQKSQKSYCCLSLSCSAFLAITSCRVVRSSSNWSLSLRTFTSSSVALSFPCTQVCECECE